MKLIFFAPNQRRLIDSKTASSFFFTPGMFGSVFTWTISSLKPNPTKAIEFFLVMLLFHQLRCFGPKKPDIEKLTKDELFPSYLFNWQNKQVHFWCLSITSKLESLGCGNGGLVVRIVCAWLRGQGFNSYNLQPFFRRKCPSKMFMESQHSVKGRRKK